MSCSPTACLDLAKEAERLQTMLNEFIGHATMAEAERELPGALYEANAELLLVPDRLRELARHAAQSEASPVIRLAAPGQHKASGPG